MWESGIPQNETDMENLFIHIYGFTHIPNEWVEEYLIADPDLNMIFDIYFRSKDNRKVETLMRQDIFKKMFFDTNVDEKHTLYLIKKYSKNIPS